MDSHSKKIAAAVFLVLLIFGILVFSPLFKAGFTIAGGNVESDLHVSGSSSVAVVNAHATGDEVGRQMDAGSAIDMPAKAPVLDTYRHAKGSIKGEVFKLQIADTAELQSHGLSDRKSIAPDEGLLFIFKDDGYYPFWMKDMNFDIDIIWIDHDMKVVHIEKSLSPSTYPASYQSKTLARYVLEVKAGTSDRLKLANGEKLDLQF